MTQDRLASIFDTIAAEALRSPVFCGYEWLHQGTRLARCLRSPGHRYDHECGSWTTPRHRDDPLGCSRCHGEHTIPAPCPADCPNFHRRHPPCLEVHETSCHVCQEDQ